MRVAAIDCLLITPLLRHAMMHADCRYAAASLLLYAMADAADYAES